MNIFWDKKICYLKGSYQMNGQFFENRTWVALTGFSVADSIINVNFQWLCRVILI
jgi:hypothetical protein